MDEYDKLFLENIKEDIEQIAYIEDENTRLNVFESVLKSLMLIKDESIHKNVKAYIQKKKDVEALITKKQKELFELEQQKNQEINKFYKEFLEKL